MLYELLRRNLPRPGQMAGFAIALFGIWLVSQAQAEEGVPQRQGIWLALLAGLGFGSFFVLIGQVGPGGVFAPLVIARLTAFVVALLRSASGEARTGFEKQPAGAVGWCIGCRW
jgi:threonine/homoserine efflux transporter RhtA